jgi:hypothetical protein
MLSKHISGKILVLPVMSLQVANIGSYCTHDSASHHDDQTRLQLQSARMALKEHDRFFCGTASSIPGLRLLEQTCRKCVAVASSFLERPVACCYPCKSHRSPPAVYTIWQSSLEIAASADIYFETVCRLPQLTVS